MPLALLSLFPVIALAPLSPLLELLNWLLFWASRCLYGRHKAPQEDLGLVVLGLPFNSQVLSTLA